jgi:ABC-type branched-subunit amino acid transport system substrate-binding protein
MAPLFVLKPSKPAWRKARSLTTREVAADTAAENLLNRRNKQMKKTKRTNMGVRLLALLFALTLILMTAAACASSETPSSSGNGNASPSQSADASQDSDTDGENTAAVGNPIKIGTSFPLTGTVAADGQYIVQAIQFAVDEVNAAGGINGRQVELVNEDDQSNPTAAAAVANKFAEDDEILAVISSYNSSCALAQIPVYKAVGLSAISPVATSPAITGMSDYFYRTCVSDAYEGQLGADYC